MNQLKIALLQIFPAKTKEQNLNKGLNACVCAKLAGADIALFPELWSNGCKIYNQDYQDGLKDALTLNDDFILSFQHLAASLNMAIALTFLERTYNNNKLQNTLVLFDQNGNRKLTYAQVHNYYCDSEKHLLSGDDFYVCTLKTNAGLVNVGAMIGSDREFPESARILMLKGAQLILVPNASFLEINRLSQLRAHAFENKLAIATCNYPEGVLNANGNSSVFDGLIDNNNNNKLSYDSCIIQADKTEAIYIAKLNFDDTRGSCNHDFEQKLYRKPSKYQLIASIN